MTKQRLKFSRGWSGKRLITVAGLICCVVLLIVLLPGCGKKTGSTATQSKTSSPSTDGKPSSSDARKTASSFIVFERDLKLYKADGQGRDEKKITSGYDTEPAVSFNGSRISYTHSDADPRSYTQLTAQPPPARSIFVAKGDGTAARRVTPREWETPTGWEPIVARQADTVWIQRDCTQPSFSHDGSRIAFVMRDHAYQESPDGAKGGYGLEAVAVIGIEGSHEGELSVVSRTTDMFGGGGFANPRFSNDDASLYFNESPGGGPPGSRIVRMNLDGSNKQVIAEYNLQASQGGRDTGFFGFGVSPVDGSIAAVEINMPGAGPDFTGKIALMDPQGSNRRYVDTGTVNVGPDSLCFSPDGRSLVFCTRPLGRRTPEPQSDIFTVGIDGAGLTSIISGGQYPAWGGSR